MPWKQESVVEQRLRFVLEVSKGERPFRQVCREFGIGHSAGYKWWQRYRAHQTLTVLADHSRRPHHSPRETAEEVVAAVEGLRGRYHWGARKLQWLLKQEEVIVSESTINRILKRRGLVAPRDVEGQARTRFQRDHPNELWQMDFKGFFVVREGRCHPLSVLDDCSRYLLGLWPLPDQQGRGVQQALEGLFREVGVPQELLLDRGAPWWSTSNAHGLTWLSVWLMDQDIALSYGRPCHPQTRGKAERWHGTLQSYVRAHGRPPDLASWVPYALQCRQEYNTVRPHEALGMRPPAQVWSPVQLRPYQEHPVPFDYATAHVRTLNSWGALSWRGQRYFVSEALRKRRVGIE